MPEDYHIIEQRARFWGNTSYEIEQCFRHVKAEAAYKWCKADDKTTINEIEDMLRQALTYSLSQQRIAIESQIGGLNSENGGTEENEED
ncbi:MAG: hypothetical protein IJQ57_07290 [Synergistaceae bacterium]|nr:hypothetical protein [Synergistaceae bacterium]